MLLKKSDIQTSQFLISSKLSCWLNKMFLESSKGFPTTTFSVSNNIDLWPRVLWPLKKIIPKGLIWGNMVLCVTCLETEYKIYSFCNPLMQFERLALNTEKNNFQNWTRMLLLLFENILFNKIMKKVLLVAGFHFQWILNNSFQN